MAAIFLLFSGCRCTCSFRKGLFVSTFFITEDPAIRTILWSRAKEDKLMAFFNSAISVMQTLVVALGAGLGIWGGINLLEGYGNDNPGANAHVR